jgi:hypothetical protein
MIIDNPSIPTYIRYQRDDLAMIEGICCSFTDDGILVIVILLA